jgi:hypothetical protein
MRAADDRPPSLRSVWHSPQNADTLGQRRAPMPASAKRDILVALLFLAGWSACTGLFWWIVFRASVMSISEPSLRSGLGMLGWVVSVWVAAIPVNLLHRRLGGSRNFFHWSMEVLSQAIGRRPGS